ncbi:MAG: hypothetical protein ABWZ25_15175 [Chitinophagaceae bacterium]
MAISSLLFFWGCKEVSTDQVRKGPTFSDAAKAQEPGFAIERKKMGQPGIEDTFINHKDGQGRKQGFWIEDGGLKEIYYFNGKKNGNYKSYSRKTGKLEGFGWYEQDRPTGIWYYYDETSSLFLTERILGNNRNLRVKNDEGHSILLPFQSYVQLYHKNGLVSEEGIALYEDSVEIDF